MKRDDLLPVALGGNKVRKMQTIAAEFKPDTLEQSLAALSGAWEMFTPTLRKAADWRPGEHGEPSTDVLSLGFPHPAAPRASGSIATSASEPSPTIGP